MRKLTSSELARATPAEFEKMPKTPLVLVLDNVRSALNVGSAFRTSDAFAVEKIMLCGITATPPHREILKTALGATETVRWEYADKVEKALGKLKASGYIIVAVEQTARSVVLPQFAAHPESRYALVFGNEVEGVGEDALRLCDLALEVPQIGTKHSLNIAVCIGIVVWEFFRKLKLPET